MRNFLHWFKDSSKMKRWIMLILVGVVFTSYGMGSLIVSSESISLIQAIKIVVYFVMLGCLLSSSLDIKLISYADVT